MNSGSSSNSSDRFDQMSPLEIRKAAVRMNSWKLRRYLEKSPKFKEALDVSNFWQMKFEHDYPVYLKYHHNIMYIHLKRHPNYKRNYLSLSRAHLDSIGEPDYKLHRLTRACVACRKIDRDISARYHHIHQMMFKLDELEDIGNTSAQSRLDLNDAIASHRQKIRALYKRRHQRVQQIADELYLELTDPFEKNRLDSFIQESHARTRKYFNV
jgi:hypothetical protein